MRILTHLKVAGTKSFRLAASQLFEFGINAQNSDKDILDMFAPPDGWCIVQVDQAGAEALVVAYLASHGKYRDLFLHGVKPHVYVALHLFLDKFRGDHPRDRYWLRPPQELKQLPEWKELVKIVSGSPFEYDIGKRTGHACCDEATEVLTKQGWVPVSTHPENIYQTDALGFGYFSRVTWNSYDAPETMHYLSGDEVDQCVTGNHKMLYETNGNRKIATADSFVKWKTGTRNIPVSSDSCMPVWTAFSDMQIRLAAAIQADGSFDGARVRFHFQKQRKMDRLSLICKHLDIPCDWTVGADGSWRVSLVRSATVAQACRLLTANKQFMWGLLELSGAQLRVLVDETVYWDGHARDDESNYRSYFSTSKQNADIIFTAARLCGIGSTMRESCGLWTVSFNVRKCSLAKQATAVKGYGSVHCPTTPSGFFLIRRNGKISLTGNSNYEMGPHTFQESVLKESEGTLVLDFAQARFFLDTYKELFPEVVAWQAEVKARVRADRLLRNLFGFPRRFEQILTDGYLRDAISWVPQSTVGCITHRAYRLLYDHIRRERLPWAIINNKHDSFAALVPVDHAREAADVMTALINQPLIGWDGANFTMRSEVQVGFNMGKAKLNKKTGEWTNPRGLKEPEWTS